MEESRDDAATAVVLLLLGAVVACTAAGFSRGVWLANLHNGLLALAFGAAGCWMLVRRPLHREGLLFAATGALEGVVFLGRQIGHTGHSDTSAWWGWLGVWPVALTIALATWTVLCFPEGRFLSPGWRRFGFVVAVAAATCSLLSALWPVEYDAAELGRHPVHLAGAAAADHVWAALAHPAYALFQLSWPLVLLARWRTAHGALRRQLAVVALAAIASGLALLAGLLIWHSPRAGLLTTPLLPLAAGWAMDRMSVGRVIEETREARGLAGLSPRENDVLGLIAQGFSNQAISDRLHLSIKTVEPIVSSIFTKLELHTDSAINRRVLAAVAYDRESRGDPADSRPQGDPHSPEAERFRRNL